jgi:hypothetical protein
MTLRLAISAAIALCTACVPLAAQSTFGSTSPPGQCGAGKTPRWIIAYSALRNIQNVDKDIASYFFNNPCTYIDEDEQGVAFPKGWASVPTADYRSYAAFQADITANAVRANAKAILYDNEIWSDTPASEQAAPAATEALFAKLAHANGYLFIATPATDLVRSQPGYNKAKPDQDQYLSMGFPGFSAGAPADIYNIQAQAIVADTASYVSYVAEAAAQGRKANPNVVVLAGISPAPTGHTVTEDQLYQAIVQTQSIVSGYWLNVSATSPQPQTVVQVLRRLQSRSLRQRRPRP